MKDLNIARKIVDQVSFHNNYRQLIEIGAGMGVLTQFLLKIPGKEIIAAEIDQESIDYLDAHFPELKNNILKGDFLRLNLALLYKEPIGIIGNFPYNISSQIFFKILEHKDLVQEVVCMLQREVAQRIASPPGNKDYGILSVLLQAYYKIEYKFTVDESVFQPPPKVKSGVIRLERNQKMRLECDDKLYFKVVKKAFQMRRKTLWNNLKEFSVPVEIIGADFAGKRAEQLGVEDFIELTLRIEKYNGSKGV